VLGYIFLGFATTLLQMWYLKRENDRKARGEEEERIGGIGSGKGGEYATLEEAKRLKGDKWSGYVYMI
jgi:hypothetical protein